MADTTKAVRCVVVTPERAVVDETADVVVVPMYNGELGVMFNRAPMIGRLGPGELRLTTGNSTKRFFVEEGFVQVRSNVVTVLTSKAEEAVAITREAAAAAASAAEALPSASAQEKLNKQKAIDRAAGMKRVAAKNPVD